jgi:hypothetical protein
MKIKQRRKYASELQSKALSDSTDYNLLELGHAVTDEIPEELRKCREHYNKIFDEDEYCIVRQGALDPLLKTVKRYKYYGWLYLPSPRPDQTVFLYNKATDTFTKRLWSLPSAARMAQLASTNIFVPKEYQEMQAWSVAFFKGTFWDFIRYQHGIDMLSEHEYFLQHREELIKAGCQVPDASYSEPFDFSKIHIEKIIDTQAAVIQ